MDVVYGDNQVLEGIRMELAGQLENLRVAMAAGLITPRPAAVYSSHDQVKMSLPALSVGFVSGGTRGNMSGMEAGVGSSIVVLYDLDFDIRIHTDYREGFLDETTVSRLLNSVNNWLHTHRPQYACIIHGYQFSNIKGMESNAAFEESYTIGGYLIITITVALAHAQQ